MAETYVTLHGLARAVTNLLQRTNTRTMFTAAHPIGEMIETTPNLDPNTIGGTWTRLPDTIGRGRLWETHRINVRRTHDSRTHHRLRRHPTHRQRRHRRIPSRSAGPGDYALTTGNQLKATMSNANTIAVQSGDAVLNGRHVHLTGTTTATVQSGTQGQKRNDLAVLRYTKNTTTGVETCSIVVLKGTPTTGTPADPAHNTGSILDGVATHDMLLYRSTNGITVGTLVPLFNVLKPMKDVRNSLTTVLWRAPAAKPAPSRSPNRSRISASCFIIEGNDDDHYPRLFHTAAEAGSIVLSFVGMNFVNGLASGKATLVRIADTSVQIIGHRIHVMEGNTSDTQCLTITRILGAR